MARRGRAKPTSPDTMLKPREERFVTEYLRDLDTKEAAVRAGYSASTGFALMKQANVRRAINEAKRRREERTEITADRVLTEIYRIATVDLGQVYDEHGNLRPIYEMPEDARRAIASVDVDELWEGHGQERKQVGVTRKVKFIDKTRALELLAKHLKLLTERVEMTADSGFAEILKAARERVNARD